MSKENFIENITEDKLFEIVDKALRYEKNRKAEKIGLHWFKIIPAAAAIALVIGMMNILPIFQKSEVGADGIGQFDNNICTSVSETTGFDNDTNKYLFDEEDFVITKELIKAMQEMQSKIEKKMQSQIGNAPWKQSTFDDYMIFEFAQGVKVTTPVVVETPIVRVMQLYDDSDNGVLAFNKHKCTIEFSTGLKVEIDSPVSTSVCIGGGILCIVIDGEAKVTRPDGTSFTIPGGTVFDKKGNVGAAGTVVDAEGVFMDTAD